MKKDKHSNEFDLFYLELPQADYFNDLSDIEIQDAYDDKDNKPVLRREDVDKLREDILAQNQANKPTGEAQDAQLFSDQSNTN